MIITILVNPIDFTMKMKFLKGEYKNIKNVISDLHPIKEFFNGVELEYTFDVTQEQLESMK